MDRATNTKLKSLFIVVFLWLISSTAFANLFSSNDDEFLHVDEAFQPSMTAVDADRIEAAWVIADGYYLYRDKIHFKSLTEGVTLGNVTLPDGVIEEDEFFGKVAIFENQLVTTIPVSRSKPDIRQADIEVEYQGCAHAGLCYPPVTKVLSVELPPAQSLAAASTGSDAPLQSEQERIASTLSSGTIGWTIGWFFLAGLLLAFTPCVFPMIPILSSIIIGQGEETSTRRAFTLSVVYVLAMAATYTIAGIIVGLTGANVQIWFQDPWVLGAFSVVFVLLALSMFGLYELQMPSALQSKLSGVADRQKSGSLYGVATMGFLSALIVGPCVTAPLIGALIYIAQTGDPYIGGIALFSLSMGMGAPLILIGTSAGKFLPKAGAWMEKVKAIFGILLLAIAVWLLERVLPRPLILGMAGSLFILTAVYLGAFTALTDTSKSSKQLGKGLGWVSLVYGVVLIVGGASGSHNLLQPLQSIGMNVASHQGPAKQQHALPFENIKGVAGLEQALASAKAEGKPVMLDFYADWCISCKEMEAFTFSDASVQSALEGYVLLQADVTANDELDQELLTELGLFGPPAILFYDPRGTEQRHLRVVGYMAADEFRQHVEQSYQLDQIAQR